MKKFFSLLLILLMQSVLASSSYRLSDLDLRKAKQSIADIQKNQAVTSTPLTIKGQKFAHGVGTHSDSTIIVDLKKKATKFEAFIGIDDYKVDVSKSVKTVLVDGKKVCYFENKDRRGRVYKKFGGFIDQKETVEAGSVRFIVHADGKEIYKSEIIRGGDAAQKISLDITGVRILKLTVDQADNDKMGDHANWAEAKFISTLAPVATDSEFVKDPNAQIAPALLSFYNKLPKYEAVTKPETDWLLDDSAYIAKVMQGQAKGEIIFTNGLSSRAFKISPNLATIDVRDNIRNRSLVRSVRPEAKVKINNSWYDVGGLKGQKYHAFLKREWLDDLVADKNSFQVTEIRQSAITPRVKWNSSRRKDKFVNWPPKGIELAMDYTHKDLPGLVLTVHYNLYDNIPLFSKWFTMKNGTGKDFNLQEYRSEILALTEYEAAVDYIHDAEKPQEIIFETNYAFGGSYYHEVQNNSIHFSRDPQYGSITHYKRTYPCLMESYPELGPDVTVKKGENFKSHQIWELVTDSYDRERRSLAQRRMYRTVAPWVTENPSVMHIRSAREEVVKQAVDDCAEVGFDTAILTFGSGANIENMSQKNLDYLKGLADYAKSKDIEMGGYSLTGSSWRGKEASIIKEDGGFGGGKFNNCPCLTSDWGDKYFGNLRKFYEYTGFTIFENDGSYPGDRCHSKKHNHKGYNDSQWENWKRMTGHYQWNLANNVYNNIPDWYFLSGGHKCAMHYREKNFSKPRNIHLVLARRDIYDGTWEKTPSMGWMHVPLTPYQGGGGAASYSPLKDNIKDYETVLLQNFLLGVQGHYRGFRLYDSPEVKAIVKRVVSFYKKNWDILNSDVIHWRRPDGRNLDGMIHVNPRLKDKAAFVVFNPTSEEITEEVTLPLYYSGLEEYVKVTDKDGKTKKYKLNRNFELKIKVTVPANGVSWYMMKDGASWYNF